nr:hypothetical protein [Tanacetum cinerariifolium]
MPRQSIFIINMLSLQVVHDLSAIITGVSNLLCISGRQGAKISPLSPQSANQSIISSTSVSYGQSRPNLSSSSRSNRTLAHLISNSGSSKASSLPKRYVRLRNTHATRSDTAAGSGYSSAKSTSSAGGRHS